MELSESVFKDRKPALLRSSLLKGGGMLELPQPFGAMR